MVTFVAKTKIASKLEARRQTGSVYGYERFSFNPRTGILEHDKKTLLFDTLTDANKVLHTLGYILDDVSINVDVEPRSTLFNPNGISCILYPHMTDICCSLS